MTEPREYTEEEVTAKFLRHLWANIDYWSSLPDKTNGERVAGVVFSTLAMLDGCALELPGFIVAPCPHESDKEYLRDNGENWFPENHSLEVNCDISGSLHDLFHKFDPARKHEAQRR